MGKNGTVVTDSKAEGKLKLVKRPSQVDLPPTPGGGKWNLNIFSKIRLFKKTAGFRLPIPCPRLEMVIFRIPQKRREMDEGLTAQ